MSLDEQVEKLREKGLHLADVAYTKQILSTVGFFKLRTYFGHFIYTDNNEYRFHKGVSFSDVMDVYAFDNFKNMHL